MELPSEIVRIFLFFFFFYFFSVGIQKYFLRHALKNSVLSLIFSSVLLIICVYFLRFLKLPLFVVSAIVILFALYTLFKIPKKISVPFEKKNVFIFLATILFSVPAFFEGFNQKGELVLLGASSHDSLWHLSLEKSLINSVPPSNQIYSGQFLYNYHYLTDLFLVWINSVTLIPIESLYLHYLPLFLSFLFVSSTLFLFETITKQKSTAYLATGIALFGSGFSYLAPLLFSGASSGQSVFWLDQPLRYLTNQQLVFSFVIVNVILVLLFRKERNWFILGLLLSCLAGIKIYAFLIYLPIFGLFSLYAFFKKRENDLLFATILAVFLGGIIVSLESTNHDFPFLFEPGWFIKTMYESNDRLNYSTWEIHRILFTQTHNYFHLIFHWGSGFLLFLFGNLGFKALGIGVFFLGLFRSKKLKEKELYILLGLATLGALVYPLLFLQKGVVWNTIQFMHYCQIPLLLIIIFGTEIWISSRKQLIIFLLIFLFSLPTSLSLLKDNFSVQAYDPISSDTVAALKHLSSIPAKRVIVSSDFNQNSVVPALAGKDVYYADPIILDILRIDYQKRKHEVDDLEYGIKICQQGDILAVKSGREALVATSTAVLFKNHSMAILACK